MLQVMRPREFHKIYTLMENSFPYDEYRSYEEQRKLLGNPRYTIYVVRDNEQEDIKAFITVYRFDDFAFVEHFAVNPKFRNQGLGAVVLRELDKMLRCLICLEVEPPETEFAQRRIRFYERNGFYLNRYPYVQPAFSEDRNAIPLYIMTTGQPVSEKDFHYIKSVLYKEVYHADV